MSDWGAKVTIPGKDVTSTDMKDYSLHSENFQHILRISNQGSGTHTVGNGPETTTVAHNLGYIPFFQVYAYWNENGTVSDLYNVTCGGSSPVNLIYVWCDADTTNIHINNVIFPAPTNVTLYYYVFVGRDQIV